ncbi:hypothetical protein DL96DRAFT_1618523 [Flagelloscypha sp. PMI_526]|nr:hypothetical protein DL96DRAFT_1618523 [Flagelloscypha sp. PMI_526]
MGSISVISAARPSSAIPLQCGTIHPDQTIALRHAVLWPDKPIEYVLLPEDAQGWHFGAFLETELAADDQMRQPVAVISLFSEPLPTSEIGDQTQSGNVRAIRFRKFACDAQLQGQGIGTALFAFALSAVRSEDINGDILWCDARRSTMPWYKRRGMVEFGPPFYKGTIEYIRMKLELNNIGGVEDN